MSRYPFVAMLICFDFVAPELGIGLRQAPAPTATVPEAAIYKDRDVKARPCEIRAAFDSPVFAISTQA
jgi:hypothetical protein